MCSFIVEGKLLTINCFNSVYLKIFVAFCELNKEFTSHGTYTWPRTSAELYAISNCQYGGAVLELPGQMARRQCNPRGNWNESDLSECATFSNSTLRNITMVVLIKIVFAGNNS